MSVFSLLRAEWQAVFNKTIHVIKVKMKYWSYAITVVIAAAFVACGPSSKDIKEKNKEIQIKDSLALKVATTPTLDCLPVFIAKEKGIFDTLQVDVSVKEMNAALDCEEMLRKNKVELAFSDLMRTERLKRKGIAMEYVTATNVYWQFILNHKARLTDGKQLGDKMIAMARYSATDYLATLGIDSMKPSNSVFRVQVNDVMVRLMMLLNNEMDAVMLPEPQATTARLAKHPVVMDSRDKGIWLGVVAARPSRIADNFRQQQVRRFIEAYNTACDSISHFGLQHYVGIIKAYCHVDDATVKALPKISFPHVAAPRQRDIDRTHNVTWRTN